MRAGISFTDDKLLQWRLVAYDDAQVHHQPNQFLRLLALRQKEMPYFNKESITGLLALQRYRIGPNFRFVDVNRPRCPLHNNAQDGPLNVANQTGEINYFPSEFSNQVSLHAARGHCMQRSKDV